MRNLIAIVSIISVLALTSTAALYVQTERVSGDLLVSRAMDRASAYALAATSTPSDDGVLTLLALQMKDDFVLEAAVYTGAGTCLGPRTSCAADGKKAQKALELLATSGAPVHLAESAVTGEGAVEVWYGLRPGKGAAEPGPGPRADTRRVLRLSVATAPGRVLPLASLVHAGVIAGLLVLLVVLTVRQARTLSREHALHETLEEQKRLAELGHLAAVIAHEIRNPLGAIKGFAQYAREKLEKGSPLQEDMQTIVVESGRLERLVRSLLSYAKQTNLNLGPHDVRDVGRRAAKMAEHAAAEAGHAIVQELGDSPLVSVIDPDEMTQALLNLIINGVEAMDAPGVVTLRAEESAGHIALHVEDTGAGIGPEIRDRIFEPFVTGKSSGTGLGLAVASRIVKAHAGLIEIADRPTAGTRFTIRLPRFEKREATR